MIQILNNQYDSLKFILSEFIKAHDGEHSIYKQDIEIARAVLLKLDRGKK